MEEEKLNLNVKNSAVKRISILCTILSPSLSRDLPLTEHLMTQIHQYMLSKAPPVINEGHWNANAGPLRVSFSAGLIVSRPVNANHIEQLQRPEARAGRVVGDRFFTWAAIGLAISIVVLVLKKFIKASGSEASWMDEL